MVSKFAARKDNVVQKRNRRRLKSIHDVRPAIQFQPRSRYGGWGRQRESHKLKGGGNLQIGTPTGTEKFSIAELELPRRSRGTDGARGSARENGKWVGSTKKKVANSEK